MPAIAAACPVMTRGPGGLRDPSGLRRVNKHSESSEVQEGRRDHSCEDRYAKQDSHYTVQTGDRDRIDSFDRIPPGGY